MGPTDSPSPPPGGTCAPASPAWPRSLKRRIDQILEEDDDEESKKQLLRANGGGVSARVDIENEVVVLRETLNSHQQSIQELYQELEEERSAAATAASEAMSMILRLQREKAEAQMEFRQFKRFAEEKMSHDQEEMAALDDLLFKRDQAVQSLTFEIQAYKHRLMSYGFGPTLSEPQTPDTATKAAAFDYPALRCKIPDHDNEDEGTDLEKYAFGETPKDQIQNLGERIFHLERMPSSSHEKGVIAFSPCKPWHPRGNSFGSSPYFLKNEDFPATVDRISERDDESDRVYTVHAVHCLPESYMSTPREFGRNESKKELDEGEEIKRLYVRLQALEADRETMRQTIMSVGTDKAQLMLLKEIAQQLCKEVTPQVQVKKVVKKPFLIRRISIISAVKWIMSFVFWRKKVFRAKYTFGITSNNIGLLLLLDKTPWIRQRRCLTRTLR